MSQVPSEKFPAGVAEFWFLEIRIFYTGGREHDASAITAMNQAHTVAEFVDGGLLHTIHQQIVVSRLLIVNGIQSPGRDHRTLTGHLSRSENKGKNGDIQIHPCHAYDFEGLTGTTGAQAL